MYKSKEFKEYLGFDHTWVVIIAIIITGMVFPLIFLNDTITSYLKLWYINLPVGILISSTVIIGNLVIFNRLLKNNHFQNGQFTHFIRRLFIRQVIYTIIIATILSGIPNYSFKIYTGGEIDNVVRSVIGCLIFLFIYMGFYLAFYYMNALKKSIKKQELLKRQNVESQLEILKNQVKPHFLFNSLNTLTSLIPEEPDLAVDYVQKLSQVYRYILEIKEKKLIPLQEELDCIKAYLFMLGIRFGKNLQFEIDEAGLNFNHHVVPLSLQLLVENAVKHNIISNKKPLKIKIHKGANGSLLVSNNLQPKDQLMPSTGTGLANIKSRYEILTKDEVEVIQTENDFTVVLPLVVVG